MRFKPSYLFPALAFLIVWALTACALQTPPAPQKILVEVTRIVQVTTAPQIVEVTREVKFRVPVEATVTPTPGLADDCFAAAQTQVELNSCAVLYYERAKEELVSVITAIKASSIPDQEKKELHQMQQEWQKSMERDCKYFYGRLFKDEKGNLHYRTGSMAPMLEAYCKADATLYRAEQLKGAYFPEGW